MPSSYFAKIHFNIMLPCTLIYLDVFRKKLCVHHLSVNPSYSAQLSLLSTICQFSWNLIVQILFFILDTLIFSGWNVEFYSTVKNACEDIVGMWLGTVVLIEENGDSTNNVWALVPKYSLPLPTWQNFNLSEPAISFYETFEPYLHLCQCSGGLMFCC
jgi:hypothetical protein